MPVDPPPSVQRDLHRLAELRRAAQQRASDEAGNRLADHGKAFLLQTPARTARAVLNPLSIPAWVLDAGADAANVEFGRWESNRERTAFNLVDLKSSDDLRVIVNELAAARNAIRELRENVADLRDRVPAAPRPIETEPHPEQASASVRDRLDQVRKARIERDVQHEATSRLLSHLVTQGTALPSRVYAGVVYSLATAPVAAISAGAGAAVAVPLLVGGLAAGSAADAVRTELHRWEQKSDLRELFTVQDRITDDIAGLAAKVTSVRANTAELNELVGDLLDAYGGPPAYDGEPGGYQVDRPEPEQVQAREAGLGIPSLADHALNQALDLPATTLFALSNPTFLVVSGLSAAASAVGVADKRTGRQETLQQYHDLDLRKQLELREVGAAVDDTFGEYLGLREELMDLCALYYGERVPTQVPAAWSIGNEPVDTRRQLDLLNGLARITAERPDLGEYVADALRQEPGNHTALFETLEREVVRIGSQGPDPSAVELDRLAGCAREVHKESTAPTSAVESAAAKINHQLAQLAADASPAERLKATVSGAAKGVSAWRHRERPAPLDPSTEISPPVRPGSFQQ